MTHDDIKRELTAIQTLAITCWAEARAMFIRGKGWVPAPREARICVANIVMNRVRMNRKRFGGNTVKGVCLARWQFSCWEPKGGWDDPNDPDLLAENFEAVMALSERLLRGLHVIDPLYLECEQIAAAAIAGELQDLTNGSTHYYSPESMQPRGRVPDWALGKTPVADCCGHLFFKGV